jgi:CheY-like chemotaxis protein
MVAILGTALDITEQKQAHIAKQEFLQNMAHDIRTPLAGIIGLAQLQEMGLESLEESKEYGQMIVGAGNQLLELLNAVIKLIDTERIKDSVKAELFDLSAFARELRALMEPSIYTKGLKFQLELDQNLPLIMSDPIKLKRILLNLLSNAAKFTKEGEISLGIKLLGIENQLAKLEIKVSDTGIGIPRDKLDKIFDRFYRAHPSYLAEYSGYGIGLYLVKEILAVLGGEIKVSSKEGQGTCFILHFKFPLSNKHSDKAATVLQSACEVQSKIATPGPVLIAEDNALVLRAVKNLLEKSGYEVIETMDGKTALDALRDNHFAWALLDIGLPELRGTEAAQQYREWEKENNKPRLPIFALTGHAVDEVLKECREAGIDRIFTKPLTGKIIQEIEAIIKDD